MKPWDVDHYKDFVRQWIKARPGGGHGELKKMAEHMGVHTTLLSHVINGAKDFSYEQFIDLTDYLELNDLEVEYLFELYAWNKAGSYRLQQFHSKKLNELKAKVLKVQHHVPSHKKIGLKQKQTFYSAWYYSAISLLTSIEAYGTVEELRAKTGLKRQQVQEILDFLVSCGLCVQRDGRYYYGAQNIHIAEDDPLVVSHHRNWRLQALKKMDSSYAREDQVFFTMPVVLTQKEAVAIKKVLLNAIEEASTLSAPAHCEKLYALNIDWFEV